MKKTIPYTISKTIDLPYITIDGMEYIYVEGEFFRRREPRDAPDATWFSCDITYILKHEYHTSSQRQWFLRQLWELIDETCKD